MTELLTTYMQQIFFNKLSFVQLLKKHVVNNLKSQGKSEKKEWDEGVLVEKAVLNQRNCLTLTLLRWRIW